MIGGPACGLKSVVKRNDEKEKFFSIFNNPNVLPLPRQGWAKRLITTCAQRTMALWPYSSRTSRGSSPVIRNKSVTSCPHGLGCRCLHGKLLFPVLYSSLGSEDSCRTGHFLVWCHADTWPRWWSAFFPGPQRVCH